MQTRIESSGFRRTMARTLRVPVLFIIFCAALAPNAVSAPVGLLSFDQVTADLSVFSILNLTGTFSLPPDLPVESDLPFENLMLNVTYSGGALETRSLAGMLGPGIYAPGEFEFASALPILSASLTGSFVGGPVTIAGAPWVIQNADFLVLLQADPGETLAPGAFAGIDVDVQIVPEPATVSMMLCALLPLCILAGRRRSPVRDKR